MPGLKRIFLGNPLHNREASHQRLANPVALAVFSSDALSSVAYATGEILLMLALAGAAALKLTVPISLAIGTLLIIVVFSYRQTIRAYPGGGGAYIVARKNIGTLAGLIAGASLLVDYVLTVAVSISAAVAEVVSAFPHLIGYRVVIAVALVMMLAVANLRGVKESGALFAGPTWAFVLLLGTTVSIGLWRFISGHPFTVPLPEHGIEPIQTLTLFLVLKAFASGCAAMTGVEAIANGVQAFRPPEAKNAARTLLAMAGILLFLFIGVSVLAVLAGVHPSETETVVSQLSRAIYGTGWTYFLVTGSVAVILVLAANTAYADFPRLSSFMAADDFLPHQLKDLGSRLVFSNGIILLTLAAIALLVIFGGVTTRLIPLYAIGVFTSFTLSQSGMIVHHLREREPHWQVGLTINAVGAVSTAIVLAVVATSKFSDGAWIVLILIPTIVTYLLWVNRQYRRVAQALAFSADDMADFNWRSFNRMHNRVVVLLSAFDRRMVRALQYAQSLKADSIEAVYVDITGSAEAMRKRWEEIGFGVRLVIIDSPYREITAPIMDYVRAIPRPTPNHVVSVVIAEFVPDNLPDNILHDQTALLLKTQLLLEPGTIVVDVPYNLREVESFADAAEAPVAAEPV